MRKKLLLAAFAFTLLTGTAEAASPFINGAHASAAIMSIGTTGDNVTTLQNNLKALSYFNYSAATGYYGTITRDAVLSFQKDYGLAADGLAGPVTNDAVAHALLKKKLVADASSYIGVPYAWGGASTSGFDCSGFVYFMFNKFGVPQVRSTAANLFTQGGSVSRAMLQPGDLVFFRIGTTGAVDHVGFYMGNGNFISSLSSKGIYVQQLDNTYWGPRYAGAKRIY
ncbi:peptidoglycan endopeptidase LytF [Paenibacillus taihuensis]|uniref:Peptidoglycan endopeptidase LytF n=1 Tax=Paenibacillus taihuensis TaxID=1156355 RepID=A0A3D9R118_9BACL|nr:NlpC/P60 family protein [Paenibacillus taihuensis]REE67677.1 peptidoglycan endopeptidase LytF [Paenibacillus taihuensis]